MTPDIIAGHLPRHSPDLPRARYVQEEGRRRAGVAVQCDEGLQCSRQRGRERSGRSHHKPLGGKKTHLILHSGQYNFAHCVLAKSAIKPDIKSLRDF